MKHLLKSALIAATLAAAPAFADAVKINAVTLAPKPVYINKPFASFVEEVNQKFAGEIEINWRGGPEVLSEQVGRDGMTVSRVRRASETPTRSNPEAVFTHQAGHSFASDVKPLGDELCVNSRATVAVSVLSMYGANLG